MIHPTGLTKLVRRGTFQGFWKTGGGKLKQKPKGMKRENYTLED